MSEELYNTLEEALLSESVFSLLSSCNDIAIVLYDSDNLRYVEMLSDFFYDNNLELTAIKELIIHGKNRIAIRKKTADISLDYIIPQMTYTGLAGKEMYNCSFLKRMLCIHIMPEEVKNEHISLIERNRYMYQILISDKKDKVEIKVNVSLKNLHCQKTKNPKRVLKYCKDRRAYLQKLIDSNYLRAAFDQCVQECRNGCEECPHATTYGQEKSCPYFQLQMAKFYENGWYVPENKKIAHFWKVKAARQGLLEAKLDLANDYVRGNGCSQDVGEAVAMLMPLADQGYASAAHALIDITSSHHDYVSPLPLIARLANNGDLDMIEKMIEIYSEGDSQTQPDPTKCEEWVVLAAELGCSKHVEALAQQYEAINDWDNATRWYLKLQELNPEMDLASKIDQLFISKCAILTSDELVARGDKCYYGYECEQDYHSAYLYYKLASERDNPDGIYRLAVCYSLGRGVELDEEQGQELYELSAIKGNANGIIKKIEILEGQDRSKEIDEWKERLRSVFVEGEKRLVPDILRLMAEDYMGEGLDVLDIMDDEKGIECLKIAMNLGDYASIRALGRCYCEGMGVEKDYTIAYKYFIEAAHKGVASAYHCLGCMYRTGDKGIDKDEKEAFKLYLKAAEKGYVSSQVMVARMLEKGIGVEKNDEERVKWLEQAGLQGNSESQYILGDMYYRGGTVQQDYKKARYWIEKAVLNGNSKAYFIYAYLCAGGYGGKRDYATALEYYEKLPNVREALNNIGVLYASGYGVEADQEKANEYYIKAAEMGDRMSMKNLAVRYLSGTGVDVDIDAAIELLRKSFEAGLREAGVKLGNIYLEGTYVDKDIDLALEYYESAIKIKPDKKDKRDVEAYVALLVKLADLYYDGDKVDMDDLKANELYHAAAEYCDLKAYHRLGLQYYNGYGVDRDPAKGIYWFRKAASEGYEDSIAFLDKHNIDWIANDDYIDLPF